MPFSTAPSRSPNGITNAATWQTMADAGLPDPTWAHIYENDFDTYTAGDFTTTVVGTGTSALVDGDGGILQLTTSAAANDAVQVQLAKAGFQLAPLHDIFFKFAGTISDTAAVFYAGLIAKSTTPLTASDGLYILRTVTTGALSLVHKIGGVTTTVAFPAACVIAANTYFEIGIHVDPQGNVEAFWNPTTGNVPANPSVFSTTAPAGRGPVATLLGASMTQVLLSPSFGITAGATATAKNLQADFVVAAKC